MIGGWRQASTASDHGADLIGGPHTDVFNREAMLDLGLDQQEEEEAKISGIDASYKQWCGHDTAVQILQIIDCIIGKQPFNAEGTKEMKE